jgi:GDPmannose 4,6-dehydratase
MKALIFGANGQDGHYLSALCKSKGIQPVEISRSADPNRGDVSSFEQVKYFIKVHQPSFIFHLAANSTTRHEALFENHETIATGTLNILECAKLHCPTAKIFIAGSGVQFVNTRRPISETDDFEALSAYSVARIASVYAARYYRSLGLRTYVGYLFHHESPLRKPNHVSQLVAMAAKRIACGSDEKIELGDISVEKEWTFAGDVANGIFTLVEQDDVFEGTIGSGIAYSIENWLDQCFRIVGKDWHDHVRPREGFNSEYQRLVSNPQTMNSLGWRPTVEFPELAAMMMAS